MQRIGGRPWSASVLSLLGWLLFAAAVAAISYFVAFVTSASLKMALLGLAGIMGLVCLLVIIPNPRLGSYLTFGLMPLSGWAFKQSPGTGFNLLNDALIVVTLAAMILHPKERKLPTWVGLPLILFIVLGIIQAFNPESGGDATSAIYAARSLIVPILLFHIAFYTFHTPKQAERFLLFLMAISVINVLWAMKQIFIGLDPAEAAWAGGGTNTTETAFYSGGETLRAFATHDTPWTYAYYTNVMLATGVGLLFAARTMTGRLLALAGVLSSGIGLYLTIVRTGYAMGAFGVFLLFILVIRHRLRIAVLLAGVGAVLVIVLLMVSASLSTGPNPSSAAQFLSNFNVLQDESLQARFRNWAVSALPLTLSAPLGKGLGTTGGAARSFNPSGYVVTDNSYLTMSIEFGWPGLALFVVILAAMLVLSLRRLARVQNMSNRWIHSSLVASLIVSILSFTFNTYVSDSSGQFFWFLLGLTAFFNWHASNEEAVPAATESPPATETT